MSVLTTQEAIREARMKAESIAAARASILEDEKRRRRQLEALFDAAEADAIAAPHPRPATRAIISPRLLAPIHHRHNVHACAVTERDVQMHRTFAEAAQRTTSRGQQDAVFSSRLARDPKKTSPHALGPGSFSPRSSMEARLSAGSPRYSHFFRSSTPQRALFADPALTRDDARSLGPGLYDAVPTPSKSAQQHHASAFMSQAAGPGKQFGQVHSLATDLDVPPKATASAFGHTSRSSPSAPSACGHTWARSRRTIPPVGTQGAHEAPLYAERPCHPRDLGASKFYASNAGGPGTIRWEQITGLHAVFLPDFATGDQQVP